MGTAFIRLSGKGQGETLRKITHGVRDEFKTAGYRARGRVFWISLTLGVLALGFAFLVVLGLVIVMWVIEGMW